MKMHEEQVEITSDLVRRLLTGQLPEIARLPIRPVDPTGTVNALFRIGREFVARLPLVEEWSEGIDRECDWLPQLARQIRSVRLPEPIFKGRPADDYPFTWAVFRWIVGQPYSDEIVADERDAARALVRFVGELRAIDVAGNAPAGGREPLLDLDIETREAIDAGSDIIDARAASAMWERCLDAPVWDGRRSWIHGDLLRPNLLVDGGRLCAVIDFGGAGVGDPATDVIPAWAVFNGGGRDVFRDALDVDDATWARARGIALHQAAMIIPYYRQTNPTFVSLARRTIEQILLEL